MNPATTSASMKARQGDANDLVWETAPGVSGAAQNKAAHKKYVVVHAGARDNYQLSIALAKNGLLETLVTDLFWPADRSWAKKLLQRLPAGAQSLLQQRNHVSGSFWFNIMVCRGVGVGGCL